MLLVKNGGRWPAKLVNVVTVHATKRPEAIYRSPLGSRFIEESSIKPPTTLIISALQGAECIITTSHIKQMPALPRMAVAPYKDDGTGIRVWGIGRVRI